jgi:hypothetical protein
MTHGTDTQVHDLHHPLILASRVVGTPVFDRSGTRLGHVADVSIDKASGKTIYAIMSFGGFLGIGESYHPLPWRVLTYDTSLGGYVIDVDRSRLERAPRYTSSSMPEWNRDYRSRIDDYWAMPGV